MHFRDRVRAAWNTLWDTEQAELLLTGPLPLWMQDAFEREADAQCVPVGDVIYRVLSSAAKRYIVKQGMIERSNSTRSTSNSTRNGERKEGIHHGK